MHDILTLYKQAQKGEIEWADFLAAQHAHYPRCANHPDQAAFGGDNRQWLCNDCLITALPAMRLWLKSQSVVIGGVEGLR